METEETIEPRDDEDDTYCRNSNSDSIQMNTMLKLFEISYLVLIESFQVSEINKNVINCWENIQ